MWVCLSVFIKAQKALKGLFISLNTTYIDLKYMKHPQNLSDLDMQTLSFSLTQAYMKYLLPYLFPTRNNWNTKLTWDESVKVEIWGGLTAYIVFLVNTHRGTQIHYQTGGQTEQESWG